MQAVAAVLFGALLLFACVVPVNAQTIENIAEASWTTDGQDQSATSNTVTFEVLESPVRLETFRPIAGGTLQMNVPASTCTLNQRSAAGTNMTAATPAMTATTIEATSSLPVGDQLIYEIVATHANLDPEAIDSIQVVLETSSNDREEVEVFETDVDSGIFAGSIRTTDIPPQPVHLDCTLSVGSGDTITVEYMRHDGKVPIATAEVIVLADPYGFVFDSEDGRPISGATVTLVDASTGLPATVFAADGVTSWPSTMISGQPVTDGAGNVHDMDPGEFRFPLAPFGSYRIEVSPPAPYTAPSTATPEQLAGLTRPNGRPYIIDAASFGNAFDLLTEVPLRIDIPVDRPAIAVELTKSASATRALPGDVVFYTVRITNPDTLGAKRNIELVDSPSEWLRLRSDTIRLDGETAEDVVTVSDDGSQITVRFDEIAAGASHTVTYAMVIRADAPEGQAVNRAEAVDSRGNRAVASASVKIEADTIIDRMTLIGRVTEGSCELERDRRGIPGVQVVLEDGSFAITDIDGRYHFEGLLPGTHVVQVQGRTLPEGGEFVDCNQSTRAAGSATSRFVRGQGGSLLVADFYAELPEDWAPIANTTPVEVLEDAEAAGAETDWLAIGPGPTEFLFPEVGHNPRAPAVRVVIRHEVGQRVTLSADGEEVNALSFDGTRSGPGNAYAISTWRGIPLEHEITSLEAVVYDADGSIAVKLQRNVNFAAAPARAELLLDRSQLIADGATSPVIAVRITDRRGRPVRAGVSGHVSINSPYESARVLANMQQRQVSGIGNSAPTWTIDGDEGVALIELAPTMVSGPLHLEFGFADGDITRRQEIESWIVPGDAEWTLVGLVEGSWGSQTVADNMDRSGNFDSDLGDNARVAFYAKGRVLGRFLLTAAYDSASQENSERLTGAIDPNAYYTVFADGSVRQFDAASTEKLYVRIETSTFYAIYGDFETGFDQTQLARYNRAATGVKAEGRFGDVHVQGFATETQTRFRRDEIQGNGLSGPYNLSSRAIVANSETVHLEVRDRFRPELIIDRQQLERFVDYDVDLLSGTISFSRPVLSQDADFNPQFIVIEYEIEELSGSGEWNAGLRADVTLADGAVRVGATAITDQGDGARTNMLAADARIRIGANTEIRAEVAASRSEGETAIGWLVEAEHHDGDIDVLAYARSLEQGFGVGQQNVGTRGRRQIGLDARYALTEDLSFVGSAWRDDSLTDLSRRDALRAQLAWRTRGTDLSLGIAHFADRYADGTTGKSTVLEGGAAQRLLGNRLELSAATSIALEGTDSIDLPTRHRLGARYAINSDVALIGSYEIASGDAIDARTLRGGIEVSPWAGARISTTLGQQDIAEFGKRSFAAFGLSQSLSVTQNLTIDATVDGNRQVGGVDAADIINRDHPVASGGHLGQNGELFEDFTAVTLGASWRQDRWAVTARGEYRDGEFADRTGILFGAVRQLGEGSVVGSGFTWTRSEGVDGVATEIFDSAISAAHRPDNSEFAFLGKLEFRSDRVINAVAGEAGPAGRTSLIVDGDALSRRLIAGLTTNWSPRDEGDEGEGFLQRSEISLFLGGRYGFDSYQDIDIEGLTLLGGLDARIGIGERFEIGGRATVRSNVSDGVISFAFGPEIGFVPTDDVLLTVGYNLSGFRDRDFSAARQTDEGLFVTVRAKLDTDTFAFLRRDR